MTAIFGALLANLMNQFFIPVGFIVGLLIQKWWAFVVGGIGYVLILELFVVPATRAEFGLGGPTVGELVPRFAAGALATLVGQGVVRMVRRSRAAK